jgi:outer membrane protein
VSKLLGGRRLRTRCVSLASLAVASVTLALWGGTATADTLEWALVQSYQNNPSLNAQRAQLRSIDENVPQALSGYRPKLTVTGNSGYDYANTLSHSVNQTVFPNSVTYTNLEDSFVQRGVGFSATQTLYNGMQTANKVRQSESQVMGARETLRLTEQTILLNAATAYMNLLRDQAILALNRSNVEVLTEQLKQTRDRFNVGEVTRTDVAQSESRLAAGRSQLLVAQSNEVTSVAVYRQVIGVDAGKLAPGTPVDRFSPGVLKSAIDQGEQQSPSVLAAMYGVDVAQLAVKVSEGALYPNLALTASASRNWDPLYNVNKQTVASVVGTLTVPLYQGGSEYSLIRQNKELLGQQRLSLDVNRDQARETVVQSWGQLDATKAEIESTTAQVNAAEIALNGVREEARVGQRTTLDVLNAQQELVNARVALVTAQHDRVVASYSLLAAVGGLSMQRLGLNVTIYDPVVHYQQVRDAWIGVRTPDGR